MNGTDGTAGAAAVLRDGTAALAAGSPAGGATRGTTSDLSIDEVLLLHGAGWEPVDLVCGVSVGSIPLAVWTWGVGDTSVAGDAHHLATSAAADRLRDECARAGGHGVVGVSVEIAVERHFVEVVLTGTAVRPHGRDGRAPAPDPFVSDLSARDFCLLRSAGWAPVGLAVGAGFVAVPRRSAGTALRQSAQNVELRNFTDAMYAAREQAMERMQQAALALGGTGVVAVHVEEGPMPFARHAVRFAAWGTAVRLAGDGHRSVSPQVILPLDDAVVVFEAGSLRGD